MEDAYTEFMFKMVNETDQRASQLDEIKFIDRCIKEVSVGKGNGYNNRGKNMLGKCLMKNRDEIRNETVRDSTE